MYLTLRVATFSFIWLLCFTNPVLWFTWVPANKYIFRGIWCSGLHLTSSEHFKSWLQSLFSSYLVRNYTRDGQEKTFSFCIYSFDFLDYSPKLLARAAMINHNGEGGMVLFWTLGLAEEVWRSPRSSFSTSGCIPFKDCTTTFCQDGWTLHLCIIFYWKEARKIHRSPLEDNCQLADRDIEKASLPSAHTGSQTTCLKCHKQLWLTANILRTALQYPKTEPSQGLVDSRPFKTVPHPNWHAQHIWAITFHWSASGGSLRTTLGGGNAQLLPLPSNKNGTEPWSLEPINTEALLFLSSIIYTGIKGDFNYPFFN